VRLGLGGHGQFGPKDCRQSLVTSWEKAWLQTIQSYFEADRLRDAASSMWKKCSLNHYGLLVQSPSFMVTAAISRPSENELNMAHLYQVSVFSHVRGYLCTLHRFGFLLNLLSPDKIPFPSSSISSPTTFSSSLLLCKHTSLYNAP